jgi:hypothetical protein
MAASYPSSLKSFTTKTNYVDLVDASHVNDLQDEVVAVETELGTDVAGSATNLKTRLAVSIADTGAVQRGTSFPGSPVADQLFARTDENQLYRRNSANDAWVALGGVENYSDGTLIECSADTERTSTAASYTKIKEFSPLMRGGTISVTWQQKTDLGSSNSSRAKVYVNDIAVGVEKTTTSNDYVTMTDTGITVAAGDVVQIYSYADAGVSHKIDDASILCANPTTPKEASGY